MDIKELTMLHSDADLYYKNARVTLAVIVEFTALNIVNLLMNGGSLFAFSISGVYVATGLGVLYNSTLSMTFGILAAVSILAGYLVCFFGSIKSEKFMYIGCMAFALDTAFLLYKFFDAGYSGVVDIIIHLFGLVLLLLGVYGGYQKSILPPLPVAEEKNQNSDAQSRPIEPISYRWARNLVEASCGEYSICYRRVKKCYELVVNGIIYARTDFQIDSHTVSAKLGDDDIEARFDGNFKFSIYLNGKKIAQKIRFW